MDVLGTISGLIRHKMFYNDEHYPMVVVGYPGVGKSSTALTLAHAVDDSFTVDRVAFKFTDFFELARSVDRMQAIVMDEAGLEIHARTWQSATNIIFSKLTQVYRFLNIFVVFTVPDISYIDAHARNEMKSILELTYKDVRKEIVGGHWWVVKRSRAFGTTQLEKLKIFDNEKEIVVDPVEFPRPPRDLWRAYSKKVDKFKRNVLDELYDELQKLEDDIMSKIDGRTIRKLINQVKALARAYEIFKDEFGWSDREIARRLGVNHQTLHNWKAEWVKILNNAITSVV